MSSLQEHMERGFLDQYERYDALEVFLTTLGFDPETVQKVSVVPHTISVTVKTGPYTTTTTDIDFLPRKEAPTGMSTIRNVGDGEERAGVGDVKRSLAALINADTSLGHADPLHYETDIHYEGPLAALLKFFKENRSELEELQ